VTAWTREELGALGAAQSLFLVAGDDDRHEVELGMVTVGANVYVRAFRGSDSLWYRAALADGHGRIRVQELASDVDLRVAAAAISDEIDAAYRVKYPATSGLIVTQSAQAATLEITPR
jgi:hypothetical protein